MKLFRPKKQGIRNLTHSHILNIIKQINFFQQNSSPKPSLFVLISSHPFSLSTIPRLYLLSKLHPRPTFMIPENTPPQLPLDIHIQPRKNYFESYKSLIIYSMKRKQVSLL